MPVDDLLGKVTEQQRLLSSASKLLKQVAAEVEEGAGLQKVLDRSRELEQLKSIAEQLGQLKQVPEELLRLAERRAAELSTRIEQGRRRFGAVLEAALRPLGLSLAGQVPDLKCGLFTVEVDFDARRTRIWYGPKHEKLRECRLDLGEIAKNIQQARENLGSKLKQAPFLDRLFRAYRRAADGKVGSPAPIVQVLAEMAPLVQSPRFRTDPRSENYKSYGRADFSYDLFRLRLSASEAPMLLPPGLRLVVATRAHTKRRDDFLWVPDDERSGSGTTYSHVQFQEDTP